MTQRRYTHTCTQTAPAPPGCMFIMLTTVCYSWIKCKIISDLGICASALLLLSLSLLFSSLYLPPLLPPFFRSSPPVPPYFFRPISPQLLVFLSHVFTFSILIVPSLSSYSLYLSGSWYISLGVRSQDYLMLASWPCGRINCIKR